MSVEVTRYSLETLTPSPGSLVKLDFAIHVTKNCMPGFAIAYLDGPASTIELDIETPYGPLTFEIPKGWENALTGVAEVEEPRCWSFDTRVGEKYGVFWRVRIPSSGVYNIALAAGRREDNYLYVTDGISARVLAGSTKWISIGVPAAVGIGILAIGLGRKDILAPIYAALGAGGTYLAGKLLGYTPGYWKTRKGFTIPIKPSVEEAKKLLELVVRKE